MEKRTDHFIYRNAWRIYKLNFAKLFLFSLSLAILLFASMVAYFFVSIWDFGVIAVLLFAFGFIPLLFSFQMIIGNVSNGEKVEYNDFYRGYRGYFAFQNRGVYSVLISIVLTLPIMILSLWPILQALRHYSP